MAEDNDNANTDGTHLLLIMKRQGEEGEGREEEEHEDEERAIHEKDFVSWLKRLSSKGNVDSVNLGRDQASVPPLELLGKRSAILTPLERCKSTIAKKGAFIASFREVNLGDGGGDLTVEQYEALILEHFLVYCAASKID